VRYLRARRGRNARLRRDLDDLAVVGKTARAGPLRNLRPFEARALAHAEADDERRLVPTPTSRSGWS